MGEWGGQGMGGTRHGEDKAWWSGDGGDKPAYGRGATVRASEGGILWGRGYDIRYIRGILGKSPSAILVYLVRYVVHYVVYGPAIHVHCTTLDMG